MQGGYGGNLMNPEKDEGGGPPRMGPPNRGGGAPAPSPMPPLQSMQPLDELEAPMNPANVAEYLGLRRRRLEPVL